MISVPSSPSSRDRSETVPKGLTGPLKPVILFSSQTNDPMTRYQLQAKADRRAAAAERRAELKATGSNEVIERRNLYKTV